MLVADHVFDNHCSPIAGFIEERAGDLEFAPFAEPLAKAFDNLQRATAKIARDSKADSEEAGAAASDYLRLFGLTALAYMWARIVKAVLARKAAGNSNEGLETKLTLAKFFNERMLPETGAHLARLSAGAETLMALPAEAF